MTEIVLKMCRARLNRQYAEMHAGTTNGLDEYLRYRIAAALEEFRGWGIHPDGGPADNLLLADYVCWSYANRDKADGMPEWLRAKRAERWLREARHFDA